MTQEIIKIAKSVGIITSKYHNIAIKDDKSLELATEVLSRANSKLTELETARKSETAPFKQEITKIEVGYKPTEQALKTLIMNVRSNISEYQTEKMRLARIEEEKIAARIGTGKGKIKFETAVARMDAIEQPTATIQASSGSLSFRPKNTLKITNSSVIPKKYLMPDEELILKSLEDGIAIPGCEIEIIQIPVNRRS